MVSPEEVIVGREVTVMGVSVEGKEEGRLIKGSTSCFPTIPVFVNINYSETPLPTTPLSKIHTFSFSFTLHSLVDSCPEDDSMVQGGEFRVPASPIIGLPV